MSVGEPPVFSVCIPAYRPDTIQDAVMSVLNQSYRRWELIIVGQGSVPSDARATHVAAIGREASQADGRVRYLHIPRHGAARALNAALAASRGRVVALLDDDCEAEDDWLQTLCDCFEDNPEVGAVAGAVLRPPRSRRGFAVCPEVRPAELTYSPGSGDNGAPEGWGWASSNLALRSDVVERVGLFDEHLGPGASFPACDDVDYFMRLESLGITMMSTPRAVVRHTHGYRYGIRALYDHKKSYACGDGGLAGKLTLLGDARGAAWLARSTREGTVEPLRKLQLHRLPASVLRVWYFRQSYRTVVRSFGVDPAAGVLREGT